MQLKRMLASTVLLLWSSVSLGQPTVQYKLMFTGTQHPGGGLKVMSVIPNGPSQRLRSLSKGYSGAMEVGDVVASINGYDIRSDRDYFRELDRSSGRPVRIGIVDKNNGHLFEWSVQPRPVSISKRESQRPGNVHVVMFGRDDETDIGFSVVINLAKIRELVHSAGVEHHNIHNVPGYSATTYKVLATIQSLRIQQEDTLFVYGNCHGGNDARHAQNGTRGHFLQLKNGALVRQTLIDSMRKKNARLTVLITESCNNNAIAIPGSSSPKRKTPGQSVNQSLMRDLLTSHAGVVDVNSSTTGNYAYASSDVGGWFTFALAQQTKYSVGIRDWSTFLDGVSKQTSFEFQHRYDPTIGLPHQDDQRPIIFTNTARRIQP